MDFKKSNLVCISLLGISLCLSFFTMSNAYGKTTHDLKAPDSDSLKNLYLREKACDEGDYGLCWIIGVEKEKKGLYDSAIEYFKKACDGGIGIGCYSLGLLYEDGNGVPKDTGKAEKFKKQGLELSRNACDKGNTLSCAHIGSSCYNKEAECDSEKLKEFNKKACDAGFFDNCEYLAGMWSFEEYGSIDIKKAKEYYQKACKGRNKTACFNLGLIWQDGYGEEKDLDKARECFQKGCDLNDGASCNNLAVIFEDGHGVSKDTDKAVMLYEKACKLDRGPGCRNLGNLFYNGEKVLKDFKKASELYKKACDLGSSAGCYILGKMWLNGEGLDKDVCKAFDLFYVSCNIEDADGCRGVAKIAGDVFIGALKADCKGTGYDLINMTDAFNIAKTFVKKTYELKPDNVDNLGGLYSIYLKLGEFEEGEKILKRVYELTLKALEKEKTAFNYSNASWYALFIPDFAAAEKYAKEGLSIDPKQFWINDNLGHAYLFQGRKQEAIAEYKKFIDNYNGTPAGIIIGNPLGEPNNPIDVLKDDFLLLKKRYPEKVALIEWAEKELGIGK